jgi:uncharacterized protein (TIGR03083 family)
MSPQLTGGSDFSWLGRPIDARPLFASELASLLGLLRTLSPAEWVRTAVPGWTVRDLAVHILGDYHGRLGWRAGGYRPTFAPGETLEAFIHRVNQEWIDRNADQDHVSIVEAIEDAGNRVARRFEAADLETAGLGVSWAGADPAPNWLDVAREFTEYWTHRQQIRHATGRDTDTATRALTVVLDTFMRALPHTLRDVPAIAGTQVQVIVEGPAGGTWTVTAIAEGWSLAEAPERRPGAPDGPAASAVRPAASVRLDAETAWRLCTRGIDPDAARAHAHTRIRGDHRLAEAVLRIVSIVR